MGQSETRAGLSFASEKAGLGSRWRVPAPTVQLSRAAPFPHPSLGTPVGIGWVAPAFLFVTAGNTLFLSEADHRPFVPPACIALLGGPQPDGVDAVGPGRAGEGQGGTLHEPSSSLIPLFTGQGHPLAFRNRCAGGRDRAVGGSRQEMGRLAEMATGCLAGPCRQSECRSSARPAPEPGKQGRL